MYKSLNEYLNRLEREGELATVEVAVDPVLEIAEITDRECKRPGGGRALLFTNTGTDFPVVTNMMGSDRRIAMALGVESLDEIGSRINELFRKATAPVGNFGDKLRMLPLLAEASRCMPRRSRSRGECQQVVLTGEGADLGVLPVIQSWPHDAGRFITLPLVHTLDPETKQPNLGMYRMQVTGPRSTGMHWHIHKTGERHYRGYKQKGERMPVTVCLGGDPVYTYCATAPLPDNLDEYLLAGFLRGRAVKLVKCVTNDLWVPADCDFVIEGYVDPSRDKFIEGPFGDHTGFYSLADLYPEFHVTAITHRRDAVWPATVVGIPPQEDYYIAKATEKIFLEPIRMALQPEVCDLWMPAAGVAHNLALVSIDKQYEGQAFKVASSMWGAGQMMFNKVLLIAPARTDIRSVGQLAPLIRKVRIPEDIMISRGVTDVLDHAAAVPGTAGKLAVDLTGNSPGEEPAGRSSGPTVEQLTDRLGLDVDLTYMEMLRLVVVRMPPVEELSPANFFDLPGCGPQEHEPPGVSAANEPSPGASSANNASPVAVKFILVVDESTAGLSGEELLWFASANTDPGRDLYLGRDILLIDGRTKAPFRTGYPVRVPNPVVSAEDTISLVDSRWPEYGLGARFESPSVRFSTLLYDGDSEIEMMKKGKKG